MIKIVKPAESPAVLRGRGMIERKRLSAQFTRGAAKYTSGEKQFEFLSSIYGHKSVKQALFAAQHGKCFLCESKFEHVAYGDVEHFRPKGGYAQKDGDALGKPGYYWLAYEWDNLLLSCQICNQQFKKNFFPLSNPPARARSHKDDLTAEQPLLINPTLEDPERIVSFRAEVPFAVRNSRRGVATIKRAGLERGPLEVRRFNYYVTMKRIYKLANLSPTSYPELKSTIVAAQLALAEAVKDSSEYAGMIRAAMAARFSVTS